MCCMYVISNAAFEQAGVDLCQPTVVMCGSAVVATFVAFAASLIGTELPVYDVIMLFLALYYNCSSHYLTNKLPCIIVLYLLIA